MLDKVYPQAKFNGFIHLARLATEHRVFVQCGLKLVGEVDISEGALDTITCPECLLNLAWLREEEKEIGT